MATGSPRHGLVAAILVLLLWPAPTASPAAGAGGRSLSADDLPPDVPPVGPLLAGANAESGQRIVRQCGACHTFEKGGPIRLGPNLWGVVMRPKAGVDGYFYTTNMKKLGEAGEIWGYEDLNLFLYSPQRYVIGTMMMFPGLSDVQARADVIKYLRSLSDEPAPLP